MGVSSILASTGVTASGTQRHHDSSLGGGFMLHRQLAPRMASKGTLWLKVLVAAS